MKNLINQLEYDILKYFQAYKSKLCCTITTKDNVPGCSTILNKTECVLSDYYAGDWVDELDELKTNVDERRVVASAGAYALGRKSDELIINELNTTTNSVAVGDAGLTKAKIFEALEFLNANDVPDDGQRFGVVGIHQWNELLSLEEFSSADYVGDNYPLLKGTESRKWMGINWILHNSLPIENGERACFIYHKNAIGFVSGNRVNVDISYHQERASHFVSYCMSQGAVLIDNASAIKIVCKE